MARRMKFSLPARFTRELFRRAATSIQVLFGRSLMGELKPKEMKTGSLGWVLMANTTMRVGDSGLWVPVQVTINVTVLGSKELPSDQELPLAAEVPA